VLNDAAIVLELLRSLRQELILADPVKIREQGALEEAQEHEPEKRNMICGFEMDRGAWTHMASRCPMTPIRKSS
jgi:hypothetical protein